MKLFLGTSGWQYSHWSGKFYPENLKPKDFLKFYAQEFNTVEVNTSFYHFTKEKTFKNWQEIVKNKKEFLFSVKLHRLFTHFRRLNLNKDDQRILKETIEGYKILGKNLGVVLIQLPPGLKKNLDLLKKFLKNLKIFKNIKFAIEFRNKSWLAKEVYQILKKNKIAFVISDSPRWPTEFIKTSNFVYLRFHGKPHLFASKYSKEELKNYAEKIKKLKPKILFVYFNNDFEGYAVENAFDFRSLF